MLTKLSDYKSYIEKNNSLLTVFVTTFNRANYLKLTIQSILDQTYKDFCLVVLDNASTDDTQKIVNQFEDHRIIYIRHKENIGSDGNGNFAFNMVSTPYFILFHDDDLMMPHFIEKELETIQKYDFDILSSFAKLIDEKGIILDYYRKTDNKPIIFSGTKYFESFISVSPNAIYCPSVIYKTEFIKKHKLYVDNKKTGPASDVFLFLEIEKHGGKIGILPLELFLYRRHSKQDSSINNSFIQLQLIKCLLNNPYYSKLLKEYKEDFFKFIKAIIIELMLSYNSKPDKQKLTNIIEELKKINNSFLKNKKLSLILKLCINYPSVIAKSLFYSKKAYQYYKKLKYCKI